MIKMENVPQKVIQFAGFLLHQFNKPKIFSHAKI